MGNAGGGDDCTDVRICDSGPLELGDSRAHQPLPRLQAFRLTRSQAIRRRHVCSF
jgi:hypothetical protein